MSGWSLNGVGIGGDGEMHVGECASKEFKLSSLVRVVRVSKKNKKSSWSHFFPISPLHLIPVAHGIRSTPRQHGHRYSRSLTYAGCRLPAVNPHPQSKQHVSDTGIVDMQQHESPGIGGNNPSRRICLLILLLRFGIRDEIGILPFLADPDDKESPESLPLYPFVLKEHGTKLGIPIYCWVPLLAEAYATLKAAVKVDASSNGQDWWNISGMAFDQQLGGPSCWFLLPFRAISR